MILPPKPDHRPFNKVFVHAGGWYFWAHTDTFLLMIDQHAHWAACMPNSFVYGPRDLIIAGAFWMPFDRYLKVARSSVKGRKCISKIIRYWISIYGSESPHGGANCLCRNNGPFSDTGIKYSVIFRRIYPAKPDWRPNFATSSPKAMRCSFFGKGLIKNRLRIW